MAILFRSPDLDPVDELVIKRVDEIRSSLRYALISPTRWFGVLRRMAFAQAGRGSLAIEGHRVSVEDAMAIAVEEEPLDSETNLSIVRGWQSAMTYVLQLAEDPHFSYSVGLLRALHFMMMNHDLSTNPGQWRPGPVSVVDVDRGGIVYEGPDADLVPGLMDALIERLNQEQTDHSTHMLVRAAMAHLNLVMIHPFKDGNGRMARCLQTLVLAREGILDPSFCSIEQYLGRNSKDYYLVLSQVGGEHWNPRGDALLWVRFCLTAHYRQATTFLNRTKEMHHLWSRLEREVAERGLPERTVLALLDAAFGYRVRNATYRSAAQISHVVASRDFKLLVDNGFLVPKGQKRGRYYIAAASIIGIRNMYREPSQVPDPYDIVRAEQKELPLE